MHAPFREMLTKPTGNIWEAAGKHVLDMKHVVCSGEDGHAVPRHMDFDVRGITGFLVGFRIQEDVHDGDEERDCMRLNGIIPDRKHSQRL